MKYTLLVICVVLQISLFTISAAVICPEIACAVPECSNGTYLQQQTEANGCTGCPTCVKCVYLFCPAAVCTPGETYSQIQYQPNGCRGCPKCVPCGKIECPLIPACTNPTSTTQTNGCPGCPTCN